MTYASFNTAGVPSATYVVSPNTPETESKDIAVLDAGKVATGTFTSEVKVNDTFVLTASQEKSIVVETASASTADEKHTVNGVIRLSGAGNTAQRSVKINAQKPGTLDVYMMSSNSDVSRTANLLNSSGEIVTSVENVVGSSLEKYTFNIPIKGTYYLTSASSGLNIYYAEITFSEVQYMSGDLNCDGLVNSHDMLLMKKGILSKSWSSNEIKATADVTGDGNVDSKDLSLLRKYLSGKNVEFALYKKPTPIEPVPKSAYEYDGFTFSGKVYLIGD